MNKKWTLYIQYAILLVLIYFVLFIKLGGFHIRWWDESVFAVNAYEMLQNGKYFSLYFDNAPDFFNLKPPLSFWFQIVFIKLFGYNELSVRLPSAIAAGLTVIITFRFVSQYFSYFWAWITALILLTSTGFVGFHCARAGDSDSLLTLFLLLTNMYFIKFVFTQNKKYILFFFIFMMLSFSVKSFASLFFFPGYLFILIRFKMFKKFVFNWHFLIGLLLFLSADIALIMSREMDTKGYINALLFSDVSRFANPIWNEHNHEALFYLNNLFESRFVFWAVFFSAGAVLLFFNEQSEKKQILYTYLVLIISYLLVVSFSVTKLYWYDMPIYSYLSLIAAYPIYLLIENIKYKGNYLSMSTKYAILMICVIYPYIIVFNKSQANTIPVNEKYIEANEIFLHKKSKKGEPLDGIKVYYSGWKGGLLFYKYKFTENNETIILTDDIKELRENDKVLVCNDSLKKLLSDTYNLISLDSCLNATLYLTTPKTD